METKIQQGTSKKTEPSFSYLLNKKSENAVVRTCHEKKCRRNHQRNSRIKPSREVTYGRPKKKWPDVVVGGLKALGVQECRDTGKNPNRAINASDDDGYIKLYYR
ncbi:Hypothetical protein CINCED_3A011977 [Cinara cedri]|uniref:Uncharacterized protein n=1 Tax=Cinara cedri TaxID=506608 RepID=A0A5E4M0T2_9HEMI|nr:Hypothetical protein CINCED_3A011977 [Cinara cedri]